MVLEPGDAEGNSTIRHRGADQWLFVLSGNGQAKVDGKRYKIGAGSLLLIEKKERHEIRNTGRTRLKTMSVYVPPAYTKGGDELPRGRK